MAIKLSERNYFDFTELLQRWECEENDIRNMIISGKLIPSYVINHVAKVVTFYESEEAGLQIWVPTEVENENAHHHESEEDKEASKYKLVLTEGFYYLLHPRQTASFDCQFVFFSRNRNHKQESGEACLMFTGKGESGRPIALDEVMRKGAVMRSEVALCETTGAEEIGQKSDPQSDRQQPKASIAEPLDPSDRPEELDAANTAFRAVQNGHGDQGATPRNRLIEYLKTTYPHMKQEAVERIATVANPDKARGRKKRDPE